MKFFKGLGGKLAIISGVPLLGILLLSGLAIYGITSAEKTIQGLSNKRIPITQLISEARIHSNAVIRLVLQDIATQGEAERKTIEAELQTRFTEMERCLADLDAIGLVPENLGNLQELIKVWKPLSEKYKGIVAKIGVESEAELSAQVSLLSKDSQYLTSILLKMGDVLSNANKKSTAAANAMAENLRRSILTVAAVVLFAALGLVFYLSFVLRRSLSGLSSSLAESGQHVATASEEMSKSSHALSSSSMQGAASLEETVASLEEINSQVSLNSTRAAEAQNLSGEALKNARAWEQRLNVLQESMHEIDLSSKHIQEIIGIIDDIAFQTNLLALNASVEAARAGDQGRGFAVVAEAVRGLSQRSANSAKEISQLINESATKTSTGVRLVGTSQVAMKEVFAVIQKLAQLNEEIAGASNEQAQGLKQISTATNQIDAATQSNAAAAEETSATAESLNAQSVILYKLVNELTKVVHGEAAASRTA